MAAENGLGEEKPHLLAFPPNLVAEQFTLMDAVGSSSQQGGRVHLPSGVCPALSRADALPQVP